MVSIGEKTNGFHAQMELKKKGFINYDAAVFD